MRAADQKMFVDELEYDQMQGGVVKNRIQIESIEGKYLNFSLDQIWCEKCTIVDKRIDLFFDCLLTSDEPHEQIRMLIKQDAKKYVIPCAVLRYMIKYANILTKNDINIFLATFISDNLIKLTNNENNYNNVNETASKVY
jgi:hypothetical protein